MARGRVCQAKKAGNGMRVCECGALLRFCVRPKVTSGVADRTGERLYPARLERAAAEGVKATEGSVAEVDDLDVAVPPEERG